MKKSFKTIHHYSVLSALVLALTACGGGGSASVAPDHGTHTSPPTAPGGDGSAAGGANTGSTAGNTNTAPKTDSGANSGNTNTGNIAGSAGNNAISPKGFKPEDSFVAPRDLPSLDSSKYRVKKPQNDDWKQEVELVLQQTNAIRQKVNKAPLRYDAELSAYAQRRAEELIGYYHPDHHRPDGSKAVSNGLVNGTRAENIAKGQPSATQVVEAWRKSEGHYKNMVNGSVTRLGIGFVRVPNSENEYYWVQIFGSNETTTPYRFDNSVAQREALYAKHEKARLGHDTAGSAEWVIFDDSSVRFEQKPSGGLVRAFKAGQDNGTKRGDHQGYLGAFDHVRFGVVQKAEGQPYRIFMYGEDSSKSFTDYKDMPTSGAAIYQGKGLLVDGQKVDHDLKAYLKADFSAKTLNGALAKDDEKVVGLHAHISGSRFYSAEGVPVTVEGSFFGKGASELGGSFHEVSTDKFGVFGAEKQ